MDGEEGCEVSLSVCMVPQAVQRAAVGERRCSLQPLLVRLCADLHRGLDVGGEFIMTRVLSARAEAVIHSSLCLFGNRKRVCGLSLGEQSGDSVAEGRFVGWPTPGSHAVCLCVCQGSKGNPGTGHDWQSAIPVLHHFISPLYPLHGRC